MNETKKIIIVCDEKNKVYANYLSQLIAEKDDQGDKIVGCKDGSIEAVIWLQKTYFANEPTLSSNTKVIFIGKIKSSNAIRPNINEVYKMFGVRYGWLGNRATIYVKDTLKTILEFEQFCYSYKLIEKNIDEKTLRKIKINNSSIGISAGPLWALPFGTTTYSMISTKIETEKLKKFQYGFAVLVFYLQHLVPFMGE